MKRSIIDLTEDELTGISPSSKHPKPRILGGDETTTRITDAESRYHESSCARLPSSCTCMRVSWIWARLNDSMDTSIGGRTGKWMLFPNSDHVDEAWKKVVELLASNQLGHSAKVAPLIHANNGCHLICVYTNDYDDVPSVFRVLHALRQLSLPCTRKALHYKTDDATSLGIYNSDAAAARAGFGSVAPKKHKNFKVSMYSSPVVVEGSVVLQRNNVGATFRSVPIVDISINASKAEIELYFEEMATCSDPFFNASSEDRSSGESSESPPKRPNVDP